MKSQVLQLVIERKQRCVVQAEKRLQSCYSDALIPINVWVIANHMPKEHGCLVLKPLVLRTQRLG